LRKRRSGRHSANKRRLEHASPESHAGGALFLRPANSSL
jgi:hypothetical protein